MRLHWHRRDLRGADNRGLVAAAIHDWPDLSPTEREAAAPDYPDPIVDHAERREAAIAMFEDARGGDD